LPPPRGRAELALVELVAAGHEGHDDLAVDGEDQALDDLADLDADGRGRVGRGLRPLREAPDLDGQPQGIGGVRDPTDVGVGRVAHRAEVSSSAIGMPASLADRQPSS
jgi:hypothetical protein